MNRLNKLRKTRAETIFVKEIYEKNNLSVRTYGIVLRYQSRSAYHNMFREYRDVTLNGAIS